jgi:hypothetical protein
VITYATARPATGPPCILRFHSEDDADAFVSAKPDERQHCEPPADDSGFRWCQVRRHPGPGEICCYIRAMTEDELSVSPA